LSVTRSTVPGPAARGPDLRRCSGSFRRRARGGPALRTAGRLTSARSRSARGRRSPQCRSHPRARGGPLRVGRGLVDLVGRTVDVDVSATAPAMTPRSDLSWKSMSPQARHGPFTGPDAAGQLRIDGLSRRGAPEASAPISRAVKALQDSAGGGALADPGSRSGAVRSRRSIFAPTSASTIRCGR
jgi:hypothetical protein